MSAAASPDNAVTTLYADHHGWLQSWLRRKLGCSHRAADLTQDTFLRLLVSGRLPAPESSRAYLTQIAKGLMVDQFRRQQIEQAYLEALARQPEAYAPSPEEQSLILETLTCIDAHLGKLRPVVRETFLLSQFDGLKYSEIAQRLSISPATVRKYMLQATLACHAALAETTPAPRAGLRRTR